MTKLVKSLKELTGSNHAQVFTQLFESIPRRISFNPLWTDGADQTDLSKVVLDPMERLILNPGDIMACSYERKNSRHERRGGKFPPRDILKSPVVLFGTPYGPACMHYVHACKPALIASSQLASALAAVDSGEIHMTEPLRHAIMGILERKPELILQLTDTKVRKNMSIETFAKFFLLTEDFMKEIDEQAEFDRAAGKTVSDGFPPLAPKKPRVIPDRRQHGRKVFSKGEKSADRRNQQAPRRKALKSGPETNSTTAVTQAAPFEELGQVVPDERLLARPDQDVVVSPTPGVPYVGTFCI